MADDFEYRSGGNGNFPPGGYKGRQQQRLDELVKNAKTALSAGTPPGECEEVRALMFTAYEAGYPYATSLSWVGLTTDGTSID